MERLAQIVAGRGEELALFPAGLGGQLHLLVQPLDQGGVLELRPQGAAEQVVLRQRQAQVNGHPGEGDQRQDDVGVAAVPEQHQWQRRRDGRQPQEDGWAIGRGRDRADDGHAEQDQDEQGGVGEIVRPQQEDRCDAPSRRHQCQSDPMALPPRRRTGQRIGIAPERQQDAQRRRLRTVDQQRPGEHRHRRPVPMEEQPCAEGDEHAGERRDAGVSKQPFDLGARRRRTMPAIAGHGGRRRHARNLHGYRRKARRVSIRYRAIVWDRISNRFGEPIVATVAPCSSLVLVVQSGAIPPNIATRFRRRVTPWRLFGRRRGSKLHTGGSSCTRQGLRATMRRRYRRRRRTRGPAGSESSFSSTTTSSFATAPRRFTPSCSACRSNGSRRARCAKRSISTAAKAISTTAPALSATESGSRKRSA